MWLKENIASQDAEFQLCLLLIITHYRHFTQAEDYFDKSSAQIVASVTKKPRSF
jgi:hypothetical protein